MKLVLPDPFALRPARSDDADALFEIHRATMREYVDQIWGWDDDWQASEFKKKFASPIGRQVICRTSDPIGFLSLDISDSDVFVGSIEIHPDFQRQGIATSLFRQLVEYSCSEQKTLRLQVFKVNTRARALYERLGFSETGKTENHIQMEQRCIEDG